MQDKTKRRPLLLAVLAAALVLGMGIAPAVAYFTDHHTTNGGMTIKVTPTTDIHEWYGERVKEITVTNAADATSPVFVRARAYSSAALPTDIAGDGWSGPASDGWYYYGSSSDAANLTPLAPGGETTKLSATITFPTVQTKTDEPPTGFVPDDSYNVVVVYESTPVQYDAQGNQVVDWDFILDSGN